MQCVRCIMYNVHKEYLFCTQILCISKYNSLANVQRIDYTQYTIQNKDMLYAVYKVFSVLAIHYTVYRIYYNKYIVEVLEKIMRRTEMIDRLS